MLVVSTVVVVVVVVGVVVVGVVVVVVVGSALGVVVVVGGSVVEVEVVEGPGMGYEVVVELTSSAAVPSVGMAGTSVTCPRTDPTAVAAMPIATSVMVNQAAKIPTRRIMFALCRIVLAPGITDR